MLKNYIFLGLLFCCSNLFSQEIVKEFDFKLERKRDYFQVTNEAEKEVVLFLNDKEKVSSIRFDDKFEIRDSLSAVRPEKNYTEIIGYSHKDQKYFLFWGSKDRKEITAQSFDFDSKEVASKETKLELKKERVIKEITINNTFYLISIVKNSSLLKFYVSDSNGNLNEKTVDLSHLKFKNIEGQIVNLYHVLYDVFEEHVIETIRTDSPPSLVLSSKKVKVYTYKNDELVFTFDNNTDATAILTINLNDYNSNLKLIEQPYIAKDEFDFSVPKSNSFLIDDKILQIKTNPSVLFLTISDQNGNKINEFKTLREEEISYKNSDVFQEAGSIRKKKILEKPKQFVRKMNNSKPAVSCYNLNNIYYTVIGSAQEISRGGAMGMGMGMGGVMGMGGGFGGGFGGPLVFFPSSYTVGNLISYQDKNVVYTNCIFDSNFNHLEDKVKPSAFEKARSFLEENAELNETVSPFTKDIYKDLIVFKFNTYLYLGNYNKQNKKYQIFSFSE